MLPPGHVLLPAAAPWLDLAGLAVFAASGALAAAKRRQTFVTLAFFALVTGTGGGTMRDLLIGAPVFWVHDARVAPLCLTVARVIWMTPARWWRGQALDWFDAVGLAAYAVYGAAKALSYDVPPVPAAVMGIDVYRPMLIGGARVLFHGPAAREMVIADISDAGAARMVLRALPSNIPLTKWAPPPPPVAPPSPPPTPQLSPVQDGGGNPALATAALAVALLFAAYMS